MRGVFLRCLEGVLLGIARECHAGRKPDSRAFAREAKACFNLYKSDPNSELPLELGEVENFIRGQADKQTAFYKALRELCMMAEKGGLACEILEPGEYPSPTFWEMGIVPGCALRIGRRFVFTAYPLVPARTEYFLTLTQGPLAADLVWVTPRYLLFFQQDQDPEGEIKQLLETLYGSVTYEDVRLEGFAKGIRRSNILLILSEDEPEEERLQRIMEEFQVPAVLVSGIDGSYSELYAGPENRVPAFIEDF